MECAHLRTNSLLKPNPYVEITVDDRIPPKRTDTIKTSSHPKWNNTFTVLVTPRSKINFCVLDHNSFRKDTTLGEKKLDLHRLLSSFNGVCNNLEVTLELVNKQNEKIGELVCFLNGLELRNYAFNSVSANSLAQNNCDTLPNRTLQDGVKVNVRVQDGPSESLQPDRNSSERHNGTLAMSPSSNNVTSHLPNGKSIIYLWKQINAKY